MDPDLNHFSPVRIVDLFVQDQNPPVPSGFFSWVFAKNIFNVKVPEVCRKQYNVVMERELGG
jgi:hypothetical protein